MAFYDPQLPGRAAARGWDTARIAGYLAGRPGVAGRWNRRALRGLVRATLTGPSNRPSGASVEFGQSVAVVDPSDVNDRSVRDGCPPGADSGEDGCQRKEFRVT
ncbi:hypothetical protein ACIODS_24515 [Micromonospora chalcea]|uniref:hypothetical protein n=1 Tax=Micromonospora chalcea TaxID=1874 RepID=UPI003817515E